MNMIPRIDSRKASDLLQIIKGKAGIYTPEWKYERSVMDGGAALAELFAQMFGETIDRLNRMPYKHYLEFLNILEVSAQSVTPAAGLAVFRLVEGSQRSVVINRGTQLYYDRSHEEREEEGTARVIFETIKDFYATPAKFMEFYSINPRQDIIEKLDFGEGPVTFFNPSGARNIQRHAFALASRDVLKLVSPADITLSLENTALSYLNEEFLARLANPGFARWSYYDGNTQIPFDQVMVRNGLLHLLKDNHDPLCPYALEGDSREEENFWITCTMQSDGQRDEILMDRIAMGSAYLHRDQPGVHIKPDQLYANDLALDGEQGGYCFGTQLIPYQCFYIASEEVFSKRRARINIEFALNMVTRQVGDANSVYQYNFYRKYVVEKVDIPVPVPDRIVVSRVTWEYWNGAGWTHLKVEGDTNPFQGGEGSFKKRISFQCPEDIAKNSQNSVEGYWIRARVVEVENAFSMYAHMLLPYLEAVSLDFAYGETLRAAEKIYTENNCVKSLSAPGTPAAFKLYEPLREKVHGVYCAFDQQPNGFPITMYFKIEGQSKAKSLLRIEYLTEDIKGEGVWHELKFTDTTEGLTEDGIISVYAPRDFKKDTLFGQAGYWLRIGEGNLKYAERPAIQPLVQKIIPNVVEIIQKETIRGELFRTDSYEPNKTITLRNRPVLECELWVNEIRDITQAEMAYLSENKAHAVEVHYDQGGQLQEFWVKWERCETFLNSGDNGRHYNLDQNSGRIAFGNGLNGKVPSPAEEGNIKVHYSFGGGKKGNLQEGSIEGLLIGIPHVDQVTNLEMTSGGSDGHDLLTLEKVGPRKLRHQGRAVTAADYESLVLEQFAEVKDVKCVGNYDAFGQPAWGYVTLVVLPAHLENRMYSLKLCRKIEQYLKQRVSCELLAGGRFSVVPAIVMKVNVLATVSLEDYDRAAEAERDIIEAVKRYLNQGMSDGQRFRIEEIPSLRNFYMLLNPLKNVARIQEIILEGRYYEGSNLRVIPLDGEFSLRYVVVTSGEHTVKIL